MEFPKFKSKDQLSLLSISPLKKKSTSIFHKNSVFAANLHFLSKIFDHFIFIWQYFLFISTKHYLFQIIKLREIRNYFVDNFLLVEKVQKDWSEFLVFFNKKFSITFLIVEISGNLVKKIKDLSKFFIFFSFPFLIFLGNQSFVSKHEKDFLSFLLPEKRKGLFSIQKQKDQKDFFYLKKLRKSLLNTFLVDFASKKGKTFNLQNQESSWFFNEKISFFAFFSNLYQEKSLCFPLYLSSEFYENTNKILSSSSFFLFKKLRSEKIQKHGLNQLPQEKLILSKWLSIYLKLKKNNYIYFSVWNPFERSYYVWKENQVDTKLLYKSPFSFDFLGFFEIFRPSSPHPLSINTTNLVREGFFEKTHIFLFSLIEPKNLIFLRGFSAPLVLKKDYVIFDNSNFQNIVDLSGKSSITTSDPFQKNIYKKRNALQLRNQRHWIRFVREWLKLYCSHDNSISFLSQKERVKKIFDLSQDIDFLNHFLKTPFSFWASGGQIFLENSFLKRISFSQEHSFFYRSYKNAIELRFSSSDVFRYSSLKNILFRFRKKINSFEFFPFSCNHTEKIKKVIDLLENFSSHIPSKDLSIYPKLFNLVSKGEKIMFQVSKSSLPFHNIQDDLLYDLDFYFNTTTMYSELSWNLNSLSQKNLVGEHKQVLNSIQNSNTPFFQHEFELVKKKREKVENLINLAKKKVLNRYNDWFFTSNWWLFTKNRFFLEIQSLHEELENIAQITLQKFVKKNKYENEKLFFLGNKVNNFLNVMGFHFQNAKILFVKEIYTTDKENHLSKNVFFIKTINNRFWGFFTWFIPSCIVYYHWVSMLSGILYLFLWLNFEKVRSFCFPSWKTFLSIITHNSFDSPSQQLRLVTYLSRGTLFSISSQFYRIYNKFFFLLNKLNFITTIDLSPRQKNIVSNSLITEKTLESRYSFWNINKETTSAFLLRTGSLDGFTFLKKWSERNRRISKFVPFLNSFSWNWLNDLFFYNQNFILNLDTLSNSSPSNLKSKPLPLFERVPYTQRWLFIGSLESGKDYIIKNIAAGSSFPLIHISIQDIKNATQDSKYTKIRKQKRWAEQLSERSFFLDNIFNLAKMISPSIFWISDLHDFDTKNDIQERNTQKLDLSLLLPSLLKILSLNIGKDGQNDITFIGSTEYPRLVDPKFVSRQRLDLVVNFRTPSFNQRQSLFSSLLKTKGFSLKGKHSYYELTSNTLGYTFRDITNLVNETLLVKTTEKTTQIDIDTIRLALYRQTSIQSVKFNKIRREDLSYKIGKALIQSILVYPKSLILLSKYYDLWKTNFYYLSNTYLEISTKKGIITEFVLLSQIFNCLAGSAARDVWTLSTNVFPDLVKSPFSLTSQLKHDFSLASNILQSLVVEFSLQDSVRTSFAFSKQNSQIIFLKNFHFTFKRKAMSYLEFLDQFPSYINSSIRTNRVSFNWNLFFNGIEQSTKNLVESLFLDKSEKDDFSSILSKNSDMNFPYERRETRRQHQKVQKIDLFFNKLLYTFYAENLGFPWKSNYVMNYTPFQSSLFFKEARPLWNPQNIMPSYSILFFDRDLLINQNLLTKLYITYGNKFQIEKLNRKRIKKQTFWLNFSFNGLDLNKNFEKKNDFGNSQIFPDKAYCFDFHFYQNLINLNGQFDQSQIQLPVYFHQGWIAADPAETNRIFDSLITTILVKNENLVAKESFLFEILLELYNYLINFFLDKKVILIQIHDVLWKKEVLFREDLEKLITKS